MPAGCSLVVWGQWQGVYNGTIQPSAHKRRLPYMTRGALKDKYKNQEPLEAMQSLCESAADSVLVAASAVLLSWRLELVCLTLYASQATPNKSWQWLDCSPGASMSGQ